MHTSSSSLSTSFANRKTTVTYCEAIPPYTSHSQRTATSTTPSNDTTMMDSLNQSNTLVYCTVSIFALVTWLIYKFVLSQTTASATGDGSAGAASASTATVTTQRQRSAATGRGDASAVSASSRAISTVNASSSSSSQQEDYFSYGVPHHPPHLKPPEGWDQKKTDLSGFLLQGIVPFRSTPANGYESRLQKDLGGETDVVVANRRERARIFAKLFSGGAAGKPPNRGANIVITVHHTDSSCTKLQKALMLLGTYYNVFVLIDGAGLFPSGKVDMVKEREAAKRFRSDLLQQSTTGNDYTLNSQILPPHRILLCATNVGRVAFVRQLHCAELVVDGDVQVTTELERFGFRVLACPKTSEGDATVSSLGKFLIP